MQTTTGSIVIAAHNESSTIGTCLDQLSGALTSGRYEVAVVSNGSTDDTAAIAERHLATAPAAHVVELDQASKAAALRRGDEVLSRFPRAYIDADIRLDEATVDRLLAALAASPDARVAAPSLRVDTTASSWAVRHYFRAWTRLPYIAGGVIGVGVYAVNEAGKDRIGVFPDLLNDDEWVRRHFSADETVITEGHFVMRAAGNVRALIRQRARVEVGNQQVRVAVPVAEPATGLRDLWNLTRAREITPVDASVFVAVVIGTRALAAWRKRRGTSTQWSMDLTSRRPSDTASRRAGDR